jgi:hypothetical protein
MNRPMINYPQNQHKSSSIDIDAWFQSYMLKERKNILKEQLPETNLWAKVEVIFIFDF